MVKRKSNHEIIATVLSMDKEHLEKWLAGLKPDTLAYLDVILAKAEKNSPELKEYLDS